MVKYSIHMGAVIPDLVLPIVQNIMAIMPNVQPRSSASEPPTDDQQSREMLHRVFTLFMMNIVKNKLHPFLWHDKIMPHLMDILGAMIQASVEVPNATVGKSCFYILQNLLNLWVTSQALALPLNQPMQTTYRNIFKPNSTQFVG